ncbi:MAG TPA: large conductance mechanosensitive channel protein MscL, partial [bacterium]|nr:large conductance mechanosensitive channel protein MscL [bacterium]
VLISFLIISIAVFLLVKAINQLRRKQEAAATTKDCPYCKSKIDLAATRCAFCTSEIKAA